MRRGFIAFMVVGMSMVGATGALADPHAPPPKLWTEKAVGKPLDPDAPVSMRAFSTLAKELSPAVVNIIVERKAAVQMPFMDQGGTGLGTGFIVNSEGFVLTNNHVVNDAGSIMVRLANEHEYPAEVVGTYAPLDIALLKVATKEPLVAAPLGSSERLEIGEWVIAIGNPFGLNHTVTAGIVSAKGRRDVTPGNEANHAKFIQTDASINPGNSGGPLINIRGEVVGINTAINAAGQGIGFAVPIDMVKIVLPQLASGHVHRSYLGVLVGPVDRELLKQAGLERGGAKVNDVKPKTPAALGGVEKGDIITSFDGRAIDHWDDLPWLASTAGAERAVKVVVYREGKAKELSVTLAPYPEEAPVAKRDPAALGLVVSELAQEKADDAGVAEDVGVEVKEVQHGSVAAEVGLKPGDVITQVNYAPVKGGKAGFDKLVGDVSAGQPLALTVKRGERFMFKVFK